MKFLILIIALTVGITVQADNTPRKLHPIFGIANDCAFSLAFARALRTEADSKEIAELGIPEAQISEFLLRKQRREKLQSEYDRALNELVKIQKLFAPLPKSTLRAFVAQLFNREPVEGDEEVINQMRLSLLRDVSALPLGSKPGPTGLFPFSFSLVAHCSEMGAEEISDLIDLNLIRAMLISRRLKLYNILKQRDLENTIESFSPEFMAEVQSEPRPENTLREVIPVMALSTSRYFDLLEELENIPDFDYVLLGEELIRNEKIPHIIRQEIFWEFDFARRHHVPMSDWFKLFITRVSFVFR